MAWISTHRFARIAPRKARLVVDLVRGLQAAEALDVLKFANKRAAVFVDKTLRAAIASAEPAKHLWHAQRTGRREQRERDEQRGDQARSAKREGRKTIHAAPV